MDNTFIEDLRLQVQTDLQALLTYTSGINNIQEARVVQEFIDTDEIYPCVVLDLTTGLSPSRHVGRSSHDLIHFDIYCLTIRPTKSSHIITCSDAVPRSGRALAEYLAVKINNYLKNYKPVDNIMAFDSQFTLNPDIPEREGVFKTIVEYEFIL